jgi:hypothetical protein
MIHAEEGETVVPMEVLDRNPVLKKRLFKSMKALGIDPGRYIVGNDLNSLNPVTGQPEFFFKKIVKRLKKAAGDISGYAAPIAGAMYGPAAGALVGAGLGAFKREQPGDPSQWAQMAGLGGLSGIASNIAGGQKWLGGKGLSDQMTFADLIKNPRSELGDYFTSDTGKTNIGDWFRKYTGSGGTTVPTDTEGVSRTVASLLRTDPGLKNESTRKAILSLLGGESEKTGMSLKQLGIMYGLGSLALGKLIESTTPEGDVGPELQTLPKGVPYDWTPELIYANPHLREGGIMDLQGGGESRGPGTGTSDSIPAMLSDGEFVMTADAVRGAGGGDRREGARKMYEAMDRLEARA